MAAVTEGNITDEVCARFEQGAERERTRKPYATAQFDIVLTAAKL